ncbi:MAG: hypothetical protein K9H64_23045 [Bacteroidales bacterium]|nr:hypothetical protein [Bacteroidales bacterium]MCF8458909.1 hypothetical protein [Bacteroidales bacterium]
MKKTFYSLVVLFSAILILSCGSEEGSKKESSPKTTNEVGVEQVVDGNLIGVWVPNKQSLWIEFLEDGTYARGREDKDPVEGNKFEFDKERMTLTLQRKKGPKILQVRFAIEQGQELVFIKAEGTEKEIKYSKIDKRPQ